MRNRFLFDFLKLKKEPLHFVLDLLPLAVKILFILIMIAYMFHMKIKNIETIFFIGTVGYFVSMMMGLSGSRLRILYSSLIHLIYCSILAIFFFIFLNDPMIGIRTEKTLIYFAWLPIFSFIFLHLTRIIYIRTYDMEPIFIRISLNGQKIGDWDKEQGRTVTKADKWWTYFHFLLMVILLLFWTYFGLIKK
jgi:hypothetical protein